jgi:hypothetical protein
MSDEEVTLVGGPDTIAHRRLLLRPGQRAPEARCVRPVNRGPWHHFVHTSGNVYHYVGKCADVRDHPPKSCSTSWHDGSHHSCAVFGPHEEHVCCCGTHKTRETERSTPAE